MRKNASGKGEKASPMVYKAALGEKRRPGALKTSSGALPHQQLAEKGKREKRLGYLRVQGLTWGRDLVGLSTGGGTNEAFGEELMMGKWQGGRKRGEGDRG